MTLTYAYSSTNRLNQAADTSTKECDYMPTRCGSGRIKDYDCTSTGGLDYAESYNEIIKTVEKCAGINARPESGVSSTGMTYSV
jgi:hypothetical protein